MDVREQRGLEIAAKFNIVKRDNAFIVPSQTGEGSYRVSLEADTVRCSCPDFELRALPCKHVYAAAFFVQRQTVTETVTPAGETVTETAAVRVTYSQDWASYNRAQMEEKDLFLHLLRDLTADVPNPVQEKGRPRMPMADAAFTGCFKVYSGMSS